MLTCRTVIGTCFNIGGMQYTGPQNFLNSLNAVDQRRLFTLGAQPRQTPPADWLQWRCDDSPLGWLSVERAAWLAQQHLDCSLLPNALVWHAANVESAERSAQLQNALLVARNQNLLTGWRNERFSFWHSECNLPDLHHPAFLNVERSGFRWLGMLSHAVHVNGFLSDGRLWCGRRALNKATDPGMLDNVTAGGLPSGETSQTCLQRELAEEAGLFNLEGHALQEAGSVRTSRLEPQGWHDESMLVFNLTLADSFKPANQDGEVDEFMCLSAKQALERMLAGEFTVDAVQTLIQGLRYCA
jgi:8-oxo-dGTP pyrophosphatase MutT (NUDIX family)